MTNPDQPPVKRTGASLLLRRAVHALANHGPAGVLRRAVDKLLGRHESDLTGPVPDLAAPHPFDLVHGVETGGYIPGERLEGLQTKRTNAGFWNTAYYGISPSTLTLALALLPEPPSGFTFVDLGCGKGRALLIARLAGFTQCVGVELSPELAEAARQNTRAMPGIAITQDDAATTVYPAGPLVVFLYNPFLRPLLRRVLRNLERQVRPHPGPVYLLYANPGYQHTMRQARWLEEIWDFSLRLSDEDAAADRHGITHERYTLYKAVT